MRFLIHTLGCKTNQYESAVLTAMLERRGHSMDAERPDAVIINTCAVTGIAGQKSRQCAAKARREHPGAVIAVCGCCARLDGLNVPEADIAAPDFEVLLERLGDMDKTAAASQTPGGTVIPSFTRTRALLKIQDGCDRHCAYCIIPLLRGSARSRALAEILREAESIAESGVGEIVITGIEIGSYADGTATLIELLEALAALRLPLRYRLGSLYPGVVDEPFVTRLADLDCICRHFHLSVQSGCDKTLAEMGRGYDGALVERAVGLLRGAFPDAGIGCDIITGFPGETETDFSECRELVKRCAFSFAHVFPYSARPGTPAARRADKVTKKTASERAALLREDVSREGLRFVQSFPGRELRVLFETELDGHADNYLKVRLESGQVPRGQLRRVLAAAVDGTVITGTLVEDN